MLPISAFQPLIAGNALVDDTLGSQADGYSHEIYANGGYWSAGFAIRDNKSAVEDWFANGLNRHIEVYSVGRAKIWEGFVNQITLTMGSLSAVRGPVLNIANRVKVVYQTISYNTVPPIAGNRAVTDAAGNTTSQGTYGILDETLNGGTGTLAEMEQVRDVYLAEYANPETSQRVNAGNGQVPSVQIECLGYVHLFNKYYYQEIASGGTEAISTKLSNVMAADPNSYFTAGSIVANASTVGQYEDDEQKAWAIIKDLVARGDSGDNRYTFGVYNDRAVTYAAVPTTAYYEHRIADRGQEVQLASTGATVFPWDVTAAQWLFLPDFLIGQTPPTNLRLDSRYLFVESVRYTAPWGLEINGGKVAKLPQILAKRGLGGF